MREQQIELPQTVEELQFLALQLREELVNFFFEFLKIFFYFWLLSSLCAQLVLCLGFLTFFGFVIKESRSGTWLWLTLP